MKFTYRTRHIPSGSISDTDVECYTEVDFLRYLNKWNVEGRGWYIYTAVSITNHFPMAGAAHALSNTVIVRKPLRDMDGVNADGGYWQSITETTH